MTTNVKILIGATGAYACIREDYRTLDVLLVGGKSAHRALRDEAERVESQIAHLSAQALLMHRAADVLETEYNAKLAA